MSKSRWSELRSSRHATATCLSEFGSLSIGEFSLREFGLPSADIYTGSDQEAKAAISEMGELLGVIQMLDALETWTWIFRFGFTPTDRCGMGGAVIESDLTSLYLKYGKESGWSIFAKWFCFDIPGLNGAEVSAMHISTALTGIRLVHACVYSEVVSLFENGLNYVWEPEDVRDAIGAQGRFFFFALLGVEPPRSTAEKDRILCDLFARMRSLEKVSLGNSINLRHEQ